MIYDTIRKNNNFSATGTGTTGAGLNVSPSTALLWVGYEDNTSGRLALKLKGGQSFTDPVAISPDSVVKTVTLASTTNLNHQLGDIFYASSINSSPNFLITVSNLGGAELKGKSVVLYIPDLPSGSTVSFGSSPIIEQTKEQASYCCVFSNLLGTTTIHCVSVWKTPGVTGTQV